MVEIRADRYSLPTLNGGGHRFNHSSYFSQQSTAATPLAVSRPLTTGSCAPQVYYTQQNYPAPQIYPILQVYYIQQIYPRHKATPNHKSTASHAWTMLKRLKGIALEAIILSIYTMYWATDTRLCTSSAMVTLLQSGSLEI
jgi:hypothetical protein